MFQIPKMEREEMSLHIVVAASMNAPYCSWRSGDKAQRAVGPLIIFTTLLTRHPVLSGLP